MGGRRALITGITGQDGSYLAELLLAEGYEVHGMVRPGSSERGLGSSEHLRERIATIEGDLLAPQSLRDAVTTLRPDELYHLAAPSYVPASWERPAETLAAIAGATAALLEAVREHSPATRIFVAASAAMFGDAPESPQSEQTPCRPRNPYATAKLAAHQLTGQLRDHHGLFACSGILYNHESVRRPDAFVTRHITRAAARIKLGLQQKVTLGDLHAVRDWSFAGDIMQGAWLALQQEQARDYILASGIPHTVSQLAETAFAYVGLTASDHIEVDPALRRGVEAAPPVGDAEQARRLLGWEPSVSFDELVGGMVDADLQALRADGAS